VPFLLAGQALMFFLPVVFWYHAKNNNKTNNSCRKIFKIGQNRQNWSKRISNLGVLYTTAQGSE
jgi:uncharacterized membrane protein